MPKDQVARGAGPNHYEYQLIEQVAVKVRDKYMHVARISKEEIDKRGANVITTKE